MIKSIPQATLIAECEAAFTDFLTLKLDQANTIFCLASLAEGEAQPHFAQLMITPQLGETLRNIAASVLSTKRRQQKQGKLDFHLYDPASQQRPYEVEYQPLTDAPDVQDYLTQLQSLTGMLPFMSHDENFIDDLHAYAHIIQLDSEKVIYAFRNYSPKKILRPGGLTAFLHSDTFTKLESPIMQFDETIDCVVWKDHVFILQKQGFNAIFREGEYIRQEGKVALSTIQDLDIIENFDEFCADAERDIHKLAKLRNTKAKGNLAAAHVKDFDKFQSIIDEYKVPVEIKVVNGQKKLCHNTRKKWALFKLLDDDYVLSPLTGNRYESNSKRQSL